MSDEKPETIYRSDYRPPDYQIGRVDLEFDLHEMDTRVKSRLEVRRNEILVGDPPPFVLFGEEIRLEEVWLDGRRLSSHEYQLGNEQLKIREVPARFVLETRVRIDPKANTALSGLYCSGSMFCTQCEAQGFRRITFFPDRPDIMSRYSTTITADAERYPILLSNGNRVAQERLDDGRHRVRWEDPFPKPSYLFALVAGDLRCHRGNFTTMSGRDVALEIWVEPQNIDRCEHALASLQKAMRWDEEVFAREYDLDIYMIVAVNDFNMGAMENKGLNVFNSKYVLARTDTATDDDREAIEGVIGHEYFHNWTGNRVTCRDWFQLTLKEGLTVFRDQLFSADMTSAAVKRISDVKVLRSAQFAEDASAMSHPIRPESYISMDNFYTATVYNKGAEVIRMLQTLLGVDGFRKGMDLYFERHDGEAVTCEDFVAAMADANDRDLDRFGEWYRQAGTPLVEAEERFDERSGRYTLRLRQTNPGASGSAEAEEAPPLHIPIALGLLGSDGADLPCQLEGDSVPGRRLVELTERHQDFVFSGLAERPVVSLLRDFTAPVKLRIERSREDLAFLMGHDADAFNRWEAGQVLATDLLLELAGRQQSGSKLELDPLHSDAFGKILADKRLDGSLKSLALTLPTEKVLGQEMEVIDVDAIHAAREFVIERLAVDHADALESTYARLSEPQIHRVDAESIAARRLKNTCLAYLSSRSDGDGKKLASAQYRAADNMTDRQAALQFLVDHEGPTGDEVLLDFYQRFEGDPLVLDKWFAVQALSKRMDTLERVLGLTRHPEFTLQNPNRLRSLIGSFCAGNQVRFHSAKGEGYLLLADTVLAVDALNPQMGSRLVSSFNQWKRFDAPRREAMHTQLERIARHTGISKDVYEIVDRALGD